MKLVARPQWQIVVVTLGIMIAISMMGMYFFNRTSMLMREQLKEKMTAIASTTAIHIDGDLLDQINGSDGMNSPFFHDIVATLNAARSAAPGIRFAYILRKTQDPMMLEFVADADSLATDEELDVNGNGTVDSDEEGSYPGDIYDIAEIPELQEVAFLYPTASKDIYVDQWGHLISGYAPIRRASTGEINAVLAIDMTADQFIKASYGAFSPAALLILIALSTLAAILVYALFENRRILFLEKINSERSGLLRLTFHQLGEPLTIMKWSLESLRDETQNPELKKLVEEHVMCMDEGLGRLNSIIDTLQLAEKVDLDTLEYLPVPTSLRALVDNAVNEWTSSLHKRNQQMHVLMNEDVTLPLDKTLLMLVFRQILVNAIEYSEDGTEVSIAVERHARHVKITVTDEGCGIPEADMIHLFEKYRRASNAPLKKPDGNGLGLYIAKGIIEKAGGKIWVQSEEHKGTSVTFTLPLSASV